MEMRGIMTQSNLHQQTAAIIFCTLKHAIFPNVLIAGQLSDGVYFSKD